MKITKIIFPGIIIAFALAISAQEPEANPEKPVKPVLFTFAFPVSTAGISSLDNTYQYSLNVLYGVNGGVQRLEMGSLANVNTGTVSGIQAAGLGNFTTGPVEKGIQFSGVYNGSLGEVNGAQFSGVLNQAKSLNGVQASIVNFSGESKGAQIGIVNIAKASEGYYPLGLVNIVEDGYYPLELTFGETIYSTVALRMGMPLLHSILSYGYSANDGNSLQAAGIGLGTTIAITETQAVSASYQMRQIIDESGLEDWKTNTLYEFQILYRMTPVKKVEIFAGPTLNIYSFDAIHDENNTALPYPYAFSEDDEGSMRHASWIGLSVGVSARF